MKSRTLWKIIVNLGEEKRGAVDMSKKSKTNLYKEEGNFGIQEANWKSYHLNSVCNIFSISFGVQNFFINFNLLHNPTRLSHFKMEWEYQLSEGKLCII